MIGLSAPNNIQYCWFWTYVVMGKAIWRFCEVYFFVYYDNIAHELHTGGRVSSYAYLYLRHRLHTFLIFIFVY